MSGKYEDDMAQQSFLIDENRAASLCPILQAQNLMLDIGGVWKVFLGDQQRPVRSDVVLQFALGFNTGLHYSKKLLSFPNIPPKKTISWGYS